MRGKDKKEFAAGIMEIAKRVQRIKFNGLFYLALAKEALEKYDEIKNQLQNLGEKDKKSRKAFLLLEESEKNQIIVITFAAMFLEAAIWDYGVSKKNQSFARKHDHGTLEDKWLKIPELVNNKKIPEDSKAIALLKKLREARNDIVHSKSEPMPETYSELVVKIKELQPSISAEEAFQCITECFNELQKIDRKWWLFNELTGRILLPGFPRNIQN